MSKQQTIDDFRDSEIYKKYIELFLKKIETKKETIYWTFYRPEKTIYLKNPEKNILFPNTIECPKCGLLFTPEHFWYYHKLKGVEDFDWVDPTIAKWLSENPLETCKEYKCILCKEEEEGELGEDYITKKILGEW